jgi:hypothetical protein
MWYTHYLEYDFTKFGELEQNRYDNIWYPKSEDFWNKRKEFTDLFYKITLVCKDEWIDLGNGMWEYYPEITESTVCFSWSVKQRLNKRTRLANSDDLDPSQLSWLFASMWANVQTTWSCLQWPDSSVDLDPLSALPEYKNKTSGTWFAWLTTSRPSVVVTLEQAKKWYVDASYEWVHIYNGFPSNSPTLPGAKWDFCKTNYYPFDVAVTATYIAMQVVFGKDIAKVSSDWSKKDWIAWAMVFSKASWLSLEEIDNHFWLQHEEVDYLVSQMPEWIKPYFNKWQPPYHVKHTDSLVVDYRWNKYKVYITNEPNQWYKEKVNLYYEKI